jgi:hypothetical protein
LVGVDASSGSVVGQIDLPQAPDQVAFGGGAVWVTSSSGDAVDVLPCSTCAYLDDGHVLTCAAFPGRR